MILMLTQDLMMSSTVSSVARSMDESFKTASSVTAAEKMIAEHQPRLMLIDLQTPALQVDSLSQLFKGLPTDQRPRPVAYAQHVNKDLLDQASAAGFDQILTRGQMDANVTDVLLQK